MMRMMTRDGRNVAKLDWHKKQRMQHKICYDRYVSLVRHCNQRDLIYPMKWPLRY